MDIVLWLFSLFFFAGLFLGALSMIGVVVEYVVKTEEEDFDDVEGIKRVFKEEDK